MTNFNPEVTQFLDELNHPFSREIDTMRALILGAEPGLTENIKWNSPNYSFEGADRITMRVQPPKQIQLIFHCGAKVTEQPEDKLIKDPAGLLTWKENNRAIATIKNRSDLEDNKAALLDIIRDWIMAAK